MIEALILGIVCLALIGATWSMHRTAAAERAGMLGAAAMERAALLDRIQSADLAQYYGARAAWVDPPMSPDVDAGVYLHDEFGFVADPIPGSPDGSTES